MAPGGADRSWSDESGPGGIGAGGVCSPLNDETFAWGYCAVHWPEIWPICPHLLQGCCCCCTGAGAMQWAAMCPGCLHLSQIPRSPDAAVGVAAVVAAAAVANAVVAAVVVVAADAAVCRRTCRHTSSRCSITTTSCCWDDFPIPLVDLLGSA